jgi:hypothetical protein
MTRSFWAIAHGDWGFALRYAPLACLVYGATALVFVWNMIGLLTGLRIRSGLYRFLGTRFGVWLVVVMIGLNWSYRLAMGLA